MKIMWKLIWDHRLSILCPMIFNGCGIGAAVSKVSEKRKKKSYGNILHTTTTKT